MIQIKSKVVLILLTHAAMLAFLIVYYNWWPGKHMEVSENMEQETCAELTGTFIVYKNINPEMKNCSEFYNNPKQT